MLWHYTDRDSAADIRGDRRIKAHPVLVRTALVGGDEVSLAGAVWFTPSDGCPTVLAKLAFHGWPVGRPGVVWRFGVADEAVPDDLPAWAFDRGYDPGVFRWMLMTAHLAGENWEAWRLHGDDVPEREWLSVQSLNGGTWAEEI